MKTLQMYFKINTTDDRRRFNTPQVGEIAAVFIGEDGQPNEADFKIYPRRNNNNIDSYDFA
jgi:hypothetical protein